MDVRCEECGTEYEFDQNRIGHQGVTVKCTQCGSVFKVHRPDRRRRPLPRATTNLGDGPQGREWLVRRQDQQMVAFRELTTLQKWIVEGRISRDDEISKNGETWKRLGNIGELEPFFSVYEKAQALNRIVEQGAPVAPAAARGSEVLASAHPLSGLSSSPTTGRSFPSSAQVITAPPTSGLSVAPLASPAPGLGSGVSRSGAPSSSVSSGPVSGALYPVLPPPLPPSPRPPSMPVRTVHPRVADARPAVERSSFSSVTSIPGPGALDSQPPPAAFGSTSLDMPDDVMSEDPVANFTRARRQGQWTVATAAIVVVGLAAGAGFAAFGPTDNPLQQLAARYGIRRATPRTTDFGPQLLEARAALERDTEQSRRRAMALLATIHAQRPTDPDVAPWRAFAAAITARSEHRWVEDVGAQPRSAQLTRSMASRRSGAERLVAQAGDWLRAVPDDPQSRQAWLAKAALALAQGKTKAAEHALDQMAQAEPKYRTDPLWLHLAAATAAASPDPSPEALRQAQTRLRDAVAARPTLIRAQVLLARVSHRLGQSGPAQQILDQVVEREPEHEEAVRLKTSWADAEQAALKKATKKKTAKKKAAVSKPPPPPKPKTRTFEEWMAVGDRLRERDQTAAALDAYGRASELKPDAAEPQIGKGWCLLDMGNLNVALVAFERAKAIDDDSAEAYYGIAETHRYLEQPTKAVQAYRAYLERAPSDTPERRAVERQIAELSEDG